MADETRVPEIAEALFERKLAHIRRAGYEIEPGFWTVRSETENHLIRLADDLDAALAAFRLTTAGRAVPGPDGEQVREDYWEHEAIARQETLQEAVAAVNKELAEQAFNASQS